LDKGGEEIKLANRPAPIEILEKVGFRRASLSDDDADRFWEFLMFRFRDSSNNPSLWSFFLEGFESQKLIA
jgi:hypothetical protein